MRAWILSRSLDPTMTLSAAAGDVITPTVTKVHRAVCSGTPRVGILLAIPSVCPRFLELTFDEMGGAFGVQTSIVAELGLPAETLQTCR